MRHAPFKLLAGATALGLFVAAPAAGQGDGDHDPQNAKSTDQDTVDVCESDSEDLDVDFLGDQTVWPPNHKYSPVTIEATSDDGDDVTLTTSVTHDEYGDPETHAGEMNGSGNTDQDAKPFMDMDTESGTNTNTHELRAERSGRGDGRTYTIDVEASDSSGDECSGSVTVEVPHDMGNGAENKKVHEPGS